jgi:hypothetical protein
MSSPFIRQNVPLRRAFTGLIAAALSGCAATDGKDTTSPPTKSPLSGSWAGAVNSQTLSLTLVEKAGVVSGTGTLSGTADGMRAVTVNGTFADPSLTAVISPGTFQPFNLQATLSGTTLSGTLSGSGFSGQAITMKTGEGSAPKLTKVTILSPTTFEAGLTRALIGLTTDQYGGRIDVPVSWSVTPTTLATISSINLLTSLAPGVATVTATATATEVTVLASQSFTFTPSPWLGTWRLITVNGLALPANIAVPASYSTRVVSRTMVIQPGGVGTFADSSFSTLWCNPPTSSGPQCDGSGRADITWAAGSFSIGFGVESATVVGKAPSSRTFGLQADGSLITTLGGGQVEVYRRE